MKINPKKRFEELRDASVPGLWGTPQADARYHAVEVGMWSDVVRIGNHAASLGWRIHTVRDGARGGNSIAADFGYRVLFEKG